MSQIIYSILIFYIIYLCVYYVSTPGIIFHNIHCLSCSAFHFLLPMRSRLQEPPAASALSQLLGYDHLEGTGSTHETLEILEDGDDDNGMKGEGATTFPFADPSRTQLLDRSSWVS